MVCSRHESVRRIVGAYPAIRFAVFIVFLVLSCEMQSPSPRAGMVENVSIYYIVADNNLSYYAWNDLEEKRKDTIRD